MRDMEMELHDSLDNSIKKAISLRGDYDALVLALREIAKGAGPFSRDPLEHASNTIDSMKEIALTALANHGNS